MKFAVKIEGECVARVVWITQVVWIFLVLIGGLGSVGTLLLLSLLTALFLCFKRSLGACVLWAAMDKSAVEPDPTSASPLESPSRSLYHLNNK